MGSPHTLIIPEGKYVVFFDGICNLCNRAVNIIIKHDPNKTFVINSLQSSLAQKILPIDYTKNLEYIIVRKPDGNLVIKSEAVFLIVKHLSWPYKILGILHILPSFLTDFLYEFIAKYRYHIFGRRKSCRLPDETTEDRFLESYQNV